MLNHLSKIQICSQCVWNNYESAPAVIANLTLANYSSCVSNVSRPHTRWFQACSRRPSKQHTTITGPKILLMFIRNHNISLFSAPMRSKTWHYYRRKRQWFGFCGSKKECVLLRAVLIVTYFTQFVMSLWCQLYAEYQLPTQPYSGHSGLPSQ